MKDLTLIQIFLLVNIGITSIFQKNLINMIGKLFGFGKNKKKQQTPPK